MCTQHFHLFALVSVLTPVAMSRKSQNAVVPGNSKLGM